MASDGPPDTAGTKVCPRCAEDVKAAALQCRFCDYQFAPEKVAALEGREPSSAIRSVSSDSGPVAAATAPTPNALPAAAPPPPTVSVELRDQFVNEVPPKWFLLIGGAIRWLLVLPVAKFVGIVVGALFAPIAQHPQACCGFPAEAGPLAILAASLLVPLAYIAAGTWTAPAYKRRTAVVLTVLTITSLVLDFLQAGSFGLLAVAYRNGTLSLSTLLVQVIALNVVGIVAALYIVRRWTRTSRSTSQALAERATAYNPPAGGRDRYRKIVARHVGAVLGELLLRERRCNPLERHAVALVRHRPASPELLRRAPAQRTPYHGLSERHLPLTPARRAFATDRVADRRRS